MESIDDEVFQWDVRTWRRSLPLWQRGLDGVRGRGETARGLGIGERDGGLSLWLALNGVDVVCTDLNDVSPAAIERHRRHGVTQRVTYARADVTALAYPDASFDVVVFKSVLGALTDRRRQAEALEELHRVLRPGGVLLFAENLAATGLHRRLRRRTAWAGYWRYLELPLDLELFRPFSRTEWTTTGLLATLGRTEGQRRLLARIDGPLCAVTPGSWHYVLYGVCTKGPEG